MNRIVRIALITLAKAAIASVVVAQVPTAHPVDAALLFGGQVAATPLAAQPVTPSGIVRVTRMPVGSTIVFQVRVAGQVCGYVDQGQHTRTGSAGAFVPFYVFTSTHFGAKHDLHQVPYLTLQSASNAVLGECN